MVHQGTKIFIVVSLLTLLIAGGVLGGSLVLIKAQKVAYAEWQQKRADAESVQQSLDLLIATEAERQSIVTRILGEEDSDIIDFITLLETLGKEHQLVYTTKSLDVKPIQTNAKASQSDIFENVLITLEVKGERPSVIRMLELLENMPQQLKVTRANLRQEGEERQWIGSFDIQVTKFKKS